MRCVGDRSARYCCAIALTKGGRVLQTFRGEVAGEIAREPRGSSGFGYDPYFLYEPFGSPLRRLRRSGSWRRAIEARRWAGCVIGCSKTSLSATLQVFKLHEESRSLSPGWGEGSSR